MLVQTDKNSKNNIIKPLSLKKNFSWTFIGNVIYAGSQWGILVLLAKLGSPAMVGKYALALAIATPVIMLTNLQLRVVQSTDTNEEYQFGDYLGLRLSMSILAIFIVFGVLLATDYSLDTKLVILIITVAKIVESISDVAYGLMQKNECMDRVSISKILKGVISLLVLSLSLWLTNSLAISLISLTISWLMVLVFYDVLNVKQFTIFKPIYRAITMKKLVKLSLPLGIVLMMGSLNTNVPRYLVEYYLNEEALGYFAAMAYLIVAGNTVISALGQSASPRLAKYYASGNIPKFRSLVIKMMFIGLVLGGAGLVIASLFSKQLLALLYGVDYAVYSDVFVLVMIAGAIYYVGAFAGYGITAARYFKIQPYLGVVWVISSVLGSVVLIPTYNLVGAAYTLIFSSIVQLFTKILVLIYLVYFEKKLQ